MTTTFFALAVKCESRAANGREGSIFGRLGDLPLTVERELVDDVSDPKAWILNKRSSARRLASAKPPSPRDMSSMKLRRLNGVCESQSMFVFMTPVSDAV